MPDFPDLNEIPIEDLRDAWRNLASYGTPRGLDSAARVLPAWSVGLDGWLDRLTNAYLRDYSRRNSHFKLAVAPYGGGKTHFVLALEGRALKENWAVCRLACASGVSLADWFALYGNVAREIRLPNTTRRGVRAIAQAASQQMQQRAAKSPSPDDAFDEIVAALEDENWPNTAFPRVMGTLLKHQRDPRANPEIGDAAQRWLQGEPETLIPKELQTLRLQKPRASERTEFGRTSFYSLVRFLPRTGVHGLVLLLDEMDTMFADAKRRALERILTAMRTMLDGDPRLDSIPLFGVFAADPSIPDLIQQRYQALWTRFQVFVPFESGQNDAAQLDLGKLGSQGEILLKMGERLLELGTKVNGWNLDRQLQSKNLTALVEVITNRILPIHARRLFVKTWCGLLEDQAANGPRECSEAQLNALTDGVYQGFRQEEEAANEGDIG